MWKWRYNSKRYYHGPIALAGKAEGASRIGSECRVTGCWWENFKLRSNRVQTSESFLFIRIQYIRRRTPRNVFVSWRLKSPGLWLFVEWDSTNVSKEMIPPPIFWLVQEEWLPCECCQVYIGQAGSYIESGSENHWHSASGSHTSR